MTNSSHQLPWVVVGLEKQLPRESLPIHVYVTNKIWFDSSNAIDLLNAIQTNVFVCYADFKKKEKKMCLLAYHNQWCLSHLGPKTDL